MKILYDNNLIGSTITSSSETTYYEDDNIIDINSLKTWRSTSTEDYVVFEVSQYFAPDAIGIKNHNFTAAATIKIEGNDTDSWTSPSFSYELTYKADVIFEEIDPGINYNFWRIYVSNATNPDGYIEIGVVYLGWGREMPAKLSTTTLNYHTNSIVEFSTSLQPFGDDRENYTTYSVTFPAISSKSIIKEIYDIVKTITPFFVVLWEDDTYYGDAPKYMVLTTNPLVFNTVGPHRYDLTLEFREVQ